MIASYSFSYTPKASTALAGITPIKLLGEGRELRFAANNPMSFTRQTPEVVTEGFYKGQQALTEGIVKGATSALGSVTGAIAQRTAEKKADTDAKLAHERAIAIAKIKSEPTVSEQLYQAERRAIMSQQLADLKGKADDRETESESDAITEGTTDFSTYSRNKKDFKTSVEEMPPAAPAAPAATAAPLVKPDPPLPNAPNFPKEVTQNPPGDPEGGKGLFAFDQNTPEDRFGNVPSRQVDMGFNLNPLVPLATFTTPELVAVAPAAPAVPVATKTNFGANTNPNLIPLREALQNRGVVADPKPSTVPSKDLSFSTINLPALAQENSGYSLAGIELPKQQNLQLPESEGQLTLADATMPLMPVSGAEGKNIVVEPALPTVADDNYTDPETEAEYRFRVESDLTGRPFANPAEARMAKIIVERELGVKAKVNGIDAGKGKRIYRVEIVEDAPSPMERVPKGMVMKQVTDKEGVQTMTLIPKMPAEQQIKSVDVALSRAKTLKTAIEKIRGIAGGFSPGVGGASNLMNKLPFSTDASTVRALNNTIKGIIGFQELVDLKAQGGTLGALSDAELNMLTSLQGSLDVDNLNATTYLEMLKDIETKTNDVAKKMEAYKKELMTVENKTNFQPIQSEKPKYQKGVSSFVKDGYTYVWDGTEFKLKQ